MAESLIICRYLSMYVGGLSRPKKEVLSDFYHLTVSKKRKIYKGILPYPSHPVVIMAKKTIDGMVVDHTPIIGSKDDVSDELKPTGDCEINYYPVGYDELAGYGIFVGNDNNSLWGFDKGCNCDIAPKTSPKGQEKLLEAKCREVNGMSSNEGGDAMGVSMLADNSNIEDTTMASVGIQEPYQHQESQSLVPMVGSILCAVLATGIFISSITSKKRAKGTGNRDTMGKLVDHNYKFMSGKEKSSVLGYISNAPVGSVEVPFFYGDHDLIKCLNDKPDMPGTITDNYSEGKFIVSIGESHIDGKTTRTYHVDGALDKAGQSFKNPGITDAVGKFNKTYASVVLDQNMGYMPLPPTAELAR